MYPLFSADVCGGGRLRDEPKERLRRRLLLNLIQIIKLFAIVIALTRNTKLLDFSSGMVKKTIKPLQIKRPLSNILLPFILLGYVLMLVISS